MSLFLFPFAKNSSFVKMVSKEKVLGTNKQINNPGSTYKLFPFWCRGLSLVSNQYVAVARVISSVLLDLD